MEKKENRFTWKEFQESEYGYYDDMKKFFQGLHKNWKNKTEDTVMLFVSRRAFCVYLLMKIMENSQIGREFQSIRTDI